MNQVEKQRKGVEALKLLNNAVTTSRIYPPEAPQVANAVDRGYTGIKSFLEQFSELEFSLKNEAPYLCGEALSEEVLDSFPNLVVYRQLRLLELNHLCLDKSVDRFAFGQLLSAFNASADKVENAGGGLQYITSLGLVGLFPVNDKEQEAGDALPEDEKAEKAKKIVKVRPELVACLLGKDDRPLIKKELRRKMGDPALCVDILSAGVGKILQGIRQKKKIIATPIFTELIENAEGQIGTENVDEVASLLAEFLEGSLKDTALSVLLSQDFPGGFGEKVYNNIISVLSTARVGAIIVIFREQIAKNRETEEDEAQVKFLGAVLNKLISSEKGKQFLSSEKAKTIIHDGEKARKKKRLEAGITGLLGGRLEVLESEELLVHLPRTVRQLLQGDNREYVPQILMKMKEYLVKAGGDNRFKVLDSVVEIGERLLVSGEFELLESLEDTLIHEAKKNNSDARVFENNVELLHGLMQSYWSRNRFKKGDKILDLFYQIRSRNVYKPDALRAAIGKVQDSNIDMKSLPVMLDKCLARPDDVLQNRLILQGPVAVRFLTEALINADNSDDRLKLIDMLTEAGTFVPEVVQERLPGHMPWYGKRNLIKLLGETGGEKDAETVLPYLHHSDYRVQREAFICIYKIGGRKRKALYLSVLDDCPALIQIQIVEAFSSFCDRDIALKLGEILSDHSKFKSSNREKLLLATVETLHGCTTNEALKAIQDFLATKGQRSSRDVSDQVWALAEKAGVHLENELKEVRKKHLQASQIRKLAIKQATQLLKGGPGQKIITGLPQEQNVRNLLAKGDKKKARQELLGLIEKIVQAKNLTQAEQLKEWLVEISGSDFNLVLKATNIIDRAKETGMKAGHLDVWVKLYDALSSEEFEELSGTLIHSSFQPGEIIVSQGALQQALYFINSGKVKLYFKEKAGEVLIRTMEKGEIFGAGVFFDASIWTMSVASVGYSDISILRFDRLHEWAVGFPELEGKLKSFCKQFEDNDKILENFAKDRRNYARFRIGGKVKTVFLDSRLRRIGIVDETELIDISVGGISYKVLSERQGDLRQILGHRVQIDIPIEGDTDNILEKEGDIIALKTSDEEASYSVHVKFYKELTSSQLDRIKKACLISQK